MELREQVEHEAAEAKAASAALTDEAVADALAVAAGLVRTESRAVLAANRVDVEGAAGLDEGLLDRLRLDEQRVEALAAQLDALAALEPLARDVETWTLPNGLRVTERRIPIGAVGANFEARPGVALDVAGQLLKSLNSAVLRTGGAALGTVTVLVDDVLRPALDSAGLPSGAVGLVRSADRRGARLLVSMPKLLPLVILRGSGETTAELARLAAEQGVRTLAHAEGGGVLYVHAEAAPDKTLAIAESSLDRLGVCNRLNLCLVDRGSELGPDLLELLSSLGMQVRDEIGPEWANDPDPRQVTVAYVDSLQEALRIANEETSGLAAGIVTENPAAAKEFLDGYRGTTGFWQATTRFTDGFALTGAPETGINVDWTPGPRGPVTYRDLWLRQYRVVGDGTQAR
jgi:glutamate-5-semialdehyde dehydrogenase